jgi:DNA topoisomerase-1
MPSRPRLDEQPSRGAPVTTLVYVDDESGLRIRRRRCGRGFVYVDAAGARVTNAEESRRIRALAIPPAWTDVRICADPAGHIQASGRDSRGRKQYCYHADWQHVRDAAKLQELVRFGEALPRLRVRVRRDLRRQGLCRSRVLALVVDLLDRTLIRVGSDIYARQNGSFGLTTLTKHHVAARGEKLRFRFTGKSGKQWDVGLADRRLARVVRRCQELPGQRLFQYTDGDGAVHAVDSADVNVYLREIGGEGVTSRRFRTWAATVGVANRLVGEPAPRTRREETRAINRALDEMAVRLGNTRAICRKSYVLPAVLESFAAGELGAAFARMAGYRRRGLTAAEARLLAWLRERQA